jgi:hypothetical protein
VLCLVPHGDNHGDPRQIAERTDIRHVSSGEAAVLAAGLNV